MNNPKNLLPLPAILFLILFFILAIHARLSGDDFFYLGLSHHFGAWKGMLYQYNAWSGRWSAHYVAIALLQFFPGKLLLPVFYFLTLAIVLDVVYRWTKTAADIFTFEKNTITLVSTAIIFTASFFFATFSIQETWFWMVIVITYLWSLAAAFFALHFILFSDKKTDYLLIAGASAFVGGAAESISLLTILGLGILLFIPSVDKSKKRKIGFALLVVLIGASFTYFAPGTEVRHSFFPNTNFKFRSYILFKSAALAIYEGLLLKLPYLLCFLSPLLLFKTKKKINETRFIQFTIIYIISIFVCLAPTVLIMSEAGPERAKCTISLFTTIYMISFFWYIKEKINHFRRYYFSVAGMSCVLILLCSKIYTQYTTCNEFALRYDARMDELVKMKNESFNGIATVKHLPSSGMLYYHEISGDTGFYDNQHLKYGLDLPFAVKAE